MTKNTRIAEELGLANLEDLMSDNEIIQDDSDNELIEYEEDDEISSTYQNPSENEEVIAAEAAHIETVVTLEQELLQHARDLMDLGHNVDIRAAGNIFSVAATMYNQAVNAQISRRDASLKKQKLLIEQAKLLKDKSSKSTPSVQVAIQNNMTNPDENKVAFVGTIGELLEARKNEIK